MHIGTHCHWFVHHHYSTELDLEEDGVERETVIWRGIKMEGYIMGD